MAWAHPTSRGSVRRKRSSADQPVMSARNVRAQIAISGKSGPKFTPRVEQQLVDRVAVGGELSSQRVEWNIIEHDRDESLALPRGQLGFHGAAQRGEQLPPLRLLGRLKPEPVR